MIVHVNADSRTQPQQTQSLMKKLLKKCKLSTQNKVEKTRTHFINMLTMTKSKRGI